MTNDTSAVPRNPVLIAPLIRIKRQSVKCSRYERRYMTQRTLIESDPSPSEMSGKEEEVFPGVTERRYFLRSSVVTAAALIVLGAATRNLSAQELAKGTSAAGADKLSWDNFLKEIGRASCRERV